MAGKVDTNTEAPTASIMSQGVKGERGSTKRVPRSGVVHDRTCYVSPTFQKLGEGNGETSGVPRSTGMGLGTSPPDASFEYSLSYSRPSRAYSIWSTGFVWEDEACLWYRRSRNEIHEGQQERKMGRDDPHSRKSEANSSEVGEKNYLRSIVHAC